MELKLDDYNPIKDGLTNNAPLINSLLIKLRSNNGGTLVIDKGDYMCGTLEIFSNICIYLKKDARLILSNNLDDFYNIDVKREKDINIAYENCEYNGKPSKYFIYAKDQKNIRICGEGIIDGNEEIFYGKQSKYHIEGSFYPRIPLVYFENIDNLEIKDVTFTRSAFWTCHMVGCRNVLIDGLNILNNLRMINCDGIDPDHCKNVTIRNANIRTADDCIVLKCTEAFKKYGETSNINVYNCNLVSTSAAIKIGTETVSDFNNITFKDINIHDTNRGISIMLRDGGNINNVEFSNINIQTRRFNPTYYWGRAEGIALTSIKRHDDEAVGNISNVTFNNINLDCENGILLYGDNNINDITFNDINLNISKKTNWITDSIDLRPSILNVLDGSYFVVYSRNVSDLKFNNLNYNVKDILIKQAFDIK